MSLIGKSEIHLPVQGTSNHPTKARVKSLASDLPVLVQPSIRRQVRLVGDEPLTR